MRQTWWNDVTGLQDLVKKTTEGKMAWNWYQDKQSHRGAKQRSQRKNTHMWLNSSAAAMRPRKGALLQKVLPQQPHVHILKKRKMITLFPTAYLRVNSRWIAELNVKGKQCNFYKSQRRNCACL